MNDSPSLRLAQICFAVFFCLFTAGVIFGFAALKPILIQEGALPHLTDKARRLTSPINKACTRIFAHLESEHEEMMGNGAFVWTSLIIEQLTLAPAETYQRLASEPTPSSTEAAAAPPSLAPPPTPERSDSAFVEALSSFSRIHYGDVQDDDAGMIETHGSKDALTGVLFGKSAREQICSKWFILLTLFVCIHMTRINFYVMSVDSQLEFYTGNASLADRLTVAFTVILPIGGFIGIPFIGLLLDYRPFMDVLGVLMLFGFLFGSLGMTSAVWTQLIGIGVFCLFRPLMYTAVSDAFAKVFGFQNFGTVYGLAMTTSGLVGLINAPLDLLVKNVLHNNFVPIGIAFTTAGVAICSALMVVVWRHTKQGAVRLE
ncbi:hypothetical protein P7C70_g5337, partial [Phenoliferia sp. Uapishka_3]